MVWQSCSAGLHSCFVIACEYGRLVGQRKQAASLGLFIRRFASKAASAPHSHANSTVWKHFVSVPDTPKGFTLRTAVSPTNPTGHEVRAGPFMFDYLLCVRGGSVPLHALRMHAAPLPVFLKVVGGHALLVHCWMPGPFFPPCAHASLLLPCTADDARAMGSRL